MSCKSVNEQCATARTDHQKRGYMNAYTIHYANGTTETVIARSAREVIQRYDLATKEHINTSIEQLEGEAKEQAIKAWSEQFGNG